MEVHKHPHHVTHKKKWGEYLLEFFMLFLAVFLGFLAENQREHMIENEREKKFAQALYGDLKIDTAILNASIKERTFVIPNIDTFRMLVHTKGINEIPAGTWAYFGRFGTRDVSVSLQDATLQQLLSSGGLRLFKNHRVENGIAQFDQASRDMKETISYQDLMISDLVKARNTLFDAWYLDEIMNLTISPENIESFKRKSFPLLSNKKEDFIQYANLCQLRSVNLKGVLASVEAVAKKAESLLSLLKKEYKLK